MAKIIHGNAPEEYQDVVMVQLHPQEHLYYGHILFCKYTWSHQMVFAQYEPGPWYIANDWRVCEKCGRVVERFNNWLNHGHGEIYGSACPEKTV